MLTDQTGQSICLCYSMVGYTVLTSTVAMDGWQGGLGHVTQH
jgi:hypothetical protein